MSWRKFESHHEETKAVKKALAEAGIITKVGHGTGTAWEWLEINLGPDVTKHEKFGKEGAVLEMTQQEAGLQLYFLHCVSNCSACKSREELRNKTIKIAHEVTGRQGDYDGRINILEQ